jgi:hypothetical protein
MPQERRRWPLREVTAGRDSTARAARARGQHERHGHEHGTAQSDAPGRLARGFERAGEDVADDREGGRPTQSAQHAVGEEPPQRQAGRSRDERRERPQDPHKAADQHGPAAVPAEEVLDALHVLGADPKPGAVGIEERPSQPPAEPEADEVSRHGSEPDQGDHGRQRNVAALRHDAAHHDRRLAGYEQANEGSRLEEGERGHGQIGPLTERAGGAGEAGGRIGKVNWAQPPQRQYEQGARGGRGGDRNPAAGPDHAAALPGTGVGPGAERRTGSRPAANPSPVTTSPAAMSKK